MKWIEANPAVWRDLLPALGGALVLAGWLVGTLALGWWS